MEGRQSGLVYRHGTRRPQEGLTDKGQGLAVLSHLPRGGHPRLAGFRVSLRSHLAPRGDRCHSLHSAPPRQVLPPEPLRLRPLPLGVRGSLPGHPPDPHTRPCDGPTPSRGRRGKLPARPPPDTSPAAGRDGPAFLSGPAPGPRPHLTLFLCSESRPAPAAALPSELAFLSRFWKRSRAVRPRCELCLGTSSRPPKLSFPAALS